MLVTGLSSQSVYGLQNDIRTHSPTHIPTPEAKQPTKEELQDQVRSENGYHALPTGGPVRQFCKFFLGGLVHFSAICAALLFSQNGVKIGLNMVHLVHEVK